MTRKQPMLVLVFLLGLLGAAAYLLVFADRVYRIVYGLALLVFLIFPIWRMTNVIRVNRVLWRAYRALLGGNLTEAERQYQHALGKARRFLPKDWGTQATCLTQLAAFHG